VIRVNLLRRHRLRWRRVRGVWKGDCRFYNGSHPYQSGSMLCEGYERFYAPCPDLELCRSSAESDMDGRMRN
jgi:hypothetical protein